MSTLDGLAADENRMNLANIERLKRKRRLSILHAIVFHAGVIVFGFIMVYPLLWLAASSLKPADEIFTRISSLIPQHFELSNYAQGWKGFGGTTFTTFYKNSLIYAVLGTVFATFSSAFVGFGFARIRFRGRGVWFGCMLATLMLPVQIQIVPQYILFTQIGWVNTFLPLLVPPLLCQAGQAFFIFMIIQFIRGIPIELDEAAEIDGSGRMGVFFKIMLPLIKPALVTVAIFSFYYTWGEFLTPLIYLNSPKLYTISVALRSFADPTSLTNWGAIFAMSFLSLVPVLIVFISFQRHIVEGISTTGMKG
jgi:ABC-type glycerol-3-phosphate transport system permease component